MTWHLENIPKVAHFYWGNKVMPFMRFMSINSFTKLNPDWTVLLHRPSVLADGLIATWKTGEHSGGSAIENVVDYTEEIWLLPRVNVERWDVAELGGDGVSEVFRSDLLRWRLLHERGGLWSDADILYLKPMDELYLNNERRYHDVETVYCCPPGKGMGAFLIGFMLGSCGNVHFKRLSELAKTSYPLKYQSIGRDLIRSYSVRNAVLEVSIGTEHNLRADVVYPFDWRTIGQVHERRMQNEIEFMLRELPQETIGLHWYAGDSRSSRMAKTWTRESYGDEQCLLSRLVGDVLRAH